MLSCPWMIEMRSFDGVQDPFFKERKKTLKQEQTATSLRDVFCLTRMGFPCFLSLSSCLALFSYVCISINIFQGGVFLCVCHGGGEPPDSGHENSWTDRSDPQRQGVPLQSAVGVCTRGASNRSP